jgi:hypothetical protein
MHIRSLRPAFAARVLALPVFAAAATIGGFAATPVPTNKSLDGVYVMHFTSTKEVYWSASKTCSFPKNIKETFTGQGQSTNTMVVVGNATFDGNGHVSISYTEYNQFNATASNDTVEITCPKTASNPANIDSGHMVQDGPSSATLTGTYEVKANGTATVTLPATGGGLELNLAGLSSTGLSSTFLIDNPDGEYGFLIGEGVLK